jgi:2-dehydro-3-deoxygalactonokinase
MAGETRVIAVDWGTSRLRAYRLDAVGEALERIASEDGIATVPPGGFPTVLERLCGAWMRAAPEAPVVMAGMVGSRNGWAEAAYAACPASPESLAAARLRVSERVSIVPGVIARGAPGPDVMRGEETLAFGTSVDEGLVCLPGTHSKWVKLDGGTIVDFASFMTGEAYGLFRNQSLLARLAEEPEDLAGFDAGLAAAADPAGLLNRLFQARARVLDGAMTGAAVGPYLSGLLVGSEVEGAFRRFGEADSITLVAEGVVAAHYVAALRARGVTTEIITPERAFLAGLARIAAAPASRRAMQP